VTWPWNSLAAAAAFLATPVASWWWVGDLSAPVANPDYALRPPDVADSTVAVFGAIATVILFAALGAMVVGVVRQRITPLWLGVVVPLVLIGLIVGVGGRTMTAGVVGANIGVGLVVFFGGPAAMVLMIGAVISAVTISQGRMRAQGQRAR